MSPAPTVREFLSTLLAPAGQGATAWGTFFTGPPESDKRHWTGQLLNLDSLPAAEGKNSYYSIAAFGRGAESRNIKNALGAVVILCDDVGTKAEAHAVLTMLGEPSFKIQTSPKSAQWGYLLSALASHEQIAPIHKRLLALNLCDKSGANLVRYGRLPAGVNSKPEYGTPVPVVCTEWHPERRFAVEDIAAKLQPAPSDQPAKSAGDKLAELVAAIERGESYHDSLNELAASLARSGVWAVADVVAKLEGHMRAAPKHDARWQERFDDIPRSVQSAFDKFAPKARADVIHLRSGELVESVDRAIAVLAKRGIEASIFARGGTLVRPYTVPRPGFNGDTVEALELATLGCAALIYELGRLITFVRFRADGTPYMVDCPPSLAQTVLATAHEWRSIPRLDAVSCSPIYVGRGELLAEPGYNAARRLFLCPPEGVRCERRPSRQQAVEALARLSGWIEEFPFAAAVDRSVMLAALFTGVLRPSLPAAPGFAFDAPEFGSGKSTAAKLIHIGAFGRAPAVLQFQRTDEELRKAIDAAQLAGAQALVFDNVPTGLVVTSETLAQVLTEPERKPRRLGVSELHEVACMQLVLLTGNNLSVGEDLTRRILVSRLDPPMDPTARRFKRPNLLEEVRAARGQILSDVFTVVAAWEASGEYVDAQVLVGYEAWARWVQRPLLWLGCADPVESVRTLQAEDLEREALETVVPLWLAIYGLDDVGVRDLAVWSATHPRRAEIEQLAEIFRAEVGEERDGGLNRKKLGRWLARMRGRWTSAGYRIEARAKTGCGKRSAQWRLVKRGGVEGLEGIGGFFPSREGNEGSVPLNAATAKKRETYTAHGANKPSLTLETLQPLGAEAFDDGM